MKPLLSLWIFFFSFTACINISEQSIAVQQTNRLSTQNPEQIKYSPLYQEPSEIFNFQLTTKTDSEKENNTYKISVIVTNKKTKEEISTVHFSTNFVLDMNTYMTDHVRSYTTGKNKNIQVVDNDFGDFIVADFNFDDKEDFAVKKGMGGNAGPLYNYFVQTKDTTFELNEFLSEKMILFPTSFDKNEKSLTVISHASAVSIFKTVYRFDSLTNKWNEKQETIKVN